MKFSRRRTKECLKIFKAHFYRFGSDVEGH